MILKVVLPRCSLRWCHKPDILQIKYPVLVIIGCLDIFSNENIGSSK